MEYEKRGHCEGARTNLGKTVVFKNPPYIVGDFSIVGPKEGEGLMGDTFGHVIDDDYFGEKTHEAAEQKMFEYAIRGAIKNAHLTPGDIDIMLSGDL